MPVAPESASAFRLATRGNGERGGVAARELALSLAVGAIYDREVENIDWCAGLFHIVTNQVRMEHFRFFDKSVTLIADRFYFKALFAQFC